MYACVLEIGRAFFRGSVRATGSASYFSRPTPPGGQATRLNYALSGLLSRFAEEIAGVRG